jgi:hypothetical protein
MNDRLIKVFLKNLATFAQDTLNEIEQGEQKEARASLAESHTAAPVKAKARYEGMLGEFPSDPSGWRSYWGLNQSDHLSGKFVLLEKWYHQALQRVRSSGDRKRIQSVLERVNLANSGNFFIFYDLLSEAQKTPESNFFTFILRSYATTGEVVGAGRDEDFGFQNDDWKEFARRMDFILEMGQYPHWYPTLLVGVNDGKVFSQENRERWLRVFGEVTDYLTPFKKKEAPVIYELSELSLTMSRLKNDVPVGKEEEFMLERIQKTWSPERLNETFTNIDCEEAWGKIRSLVARHFQLNKDRLLEVYRMSAPRPARQIELFNLETFLEVNSLADEGPVDVQDDDFQDDVQSTAENKPASKERIDLGAAGVNHPAFSLAVERTVGSFALVYAVLVGRTLEPETQPSV